MYKKPLRSRKALIIVSILTASTALALTATAASNTTEPFAFIDQVREFFGMKTAAVAQETLFVDLVGDYRSAGTVDLHTATNWEVWDGSNWVIASLAPDGNVTSGNTITVQTSHFWNNAGPSPTIPAGVTLIHKGTSGTF